MLVKRIVVELVLHPRVLVMLATIDVVVAVVISL